MIPPLEELLVALSKLPGIGRRSAERISFYLLAKPEEARRLGEAATSLHDRVKACTRCGNFATGELCPICTDNKRDPSTVCVVARPWEIQSVERTGEFRGLYHVLGGLVSPSAGISPDDLTVDELARRVPEEGIQEVVLALEPNMEGDLTGMHIARKLRPAGVRVTRIAQGIPVGRDLESADEVTLGRALRGRVQL
ncbi:MAG: recombination mediator RecR [Candidatus Bipolaricaulota bacterium]